MLEMLKNQGNTMKNLQDVYKRQSDEFCEKLLLQEKVLAVPGNAFGECGEGFIRACYASSMENIMEALKRIEKFLNEVR